MINIQSNENRIAIGSEIIPKNKYTVKLFDDYVRIKFLGSSETMNLRYEEVTINGSEAESNQDLFEYLDANSFKEGGGALGEGVQSVTGDLVTGTLENPVVNAPTWDQIPDVPSVFQPDAHTHVISDITNLNIDHSPEPSTVVERTTTGQGKFAPSVNPDEAVVQSQFQSGLELKVDKVTGEGLSPEKFTSDEKAKLAGLENVHYKGWFTSLTSLQSTYSSPEEGSHALVDDVSGTLVYIWDIDTESWVARVGESTEITAAQVKTYYESNPDTNSFTDAEKSKLASITSVFTSALKTAYDNTVSWITANGANILNHLTNKSNPHDVTAAQLGLGDVDNTKDVDKPISNPTKNYVDSFVGKAWIPDYANMETTNRITSSGGSWTSDRTGFVYILSRGYNSGIYNTRVAYINDKEVGRVWVEATSGTSTARSGSFSNIYPVKPGDLIRLYGNLEVQCFFIPGVWV